MPEFQINGKNILDVCEVVDISDTRPKSLLFSSGLVSVPGLTDQNKTILGKPNDTSYGFLYDASNGRIKVDTQTDFLAKKGTRPKFVGARAIGWASNWSVTSGSDGNSEMTLTYSSSSNSITCKHTKVSNYFTTEDYLANNAVLANTSVVLFCLCGGGGGGGGSGVGHGGGGGGGAATVSFLIDFSKLPSGYIIIGVGHPGRPGSSTPYTGHSGEGGSASYLKIPGAGLSNDIAFYAHGGYGGTKGGDGGGGGAGGGVDVYLSTQSYFRIFSQCAGARGGTGSASAGGSTGCDSELKPNYYISTPDGTLRLDPQYGGLAGGGKNGGGGGGGGGVGLWAGPWYQGIPGGGNGAYDNTNNAGSGELGGGGGGAGGTNLFDGKYGERGGRGACFMYY